MGVVWYHRGVVRIFYPLGEVMDFCLTHWKIGVSEKSALMLLDAIIVSISCIHVIYINGIFAKEYIPPF